MPDDRAPVKTEDTRRLTFYLTEPQRRDFLARMAAVGETSTTRFLVAELGLSDGSEKAPAAVTTEA